jgi:hypothetical protein
MGKGLLNHIANEPYGYRIYFSEPDADYKSINSSDVADYL